MRSLRRLVLAWAVALACAPPGALALFALRGCAKHVTICDVNHDQLEEATETLRRQGYNPAHHFDTVCTNTLGLASRSKKYDMLVCDMFGATLGERGLVYYMWDLLHRGIVRTFETTNDARGTTTVHYTVPCEGAMTARLYHIPAATVLTRAEYRGISINATKASGTIKASKAIKASTAINAIETIENHRNH